MMPSTTTQQQGGNPGLAALFRNNQPAAPGAMPGQLPQIMAPTTPNIGMPPRPQMPMQRAAPAQMMPQRTFKSVADLMQYTGKNPNALTPEMANMWKRSLQRNGGR